MRALITGITGQDGSYLAEFLLDKGYEVGGIVRRTSTPSTSRITDFMSKIEVYDGDLVDSNSLDRAVSSFQPTEVYNLAAQSFVGTSWTQPIVTSQVVALGCLNVLESVRKYAPDARFYQASSSEMFGKVLQTPQRENTPFYPRSPYGVAKCFAHQMTVNYRESYGMHASCGILFNHESPRRGKEFVTRKITDGVAKVFHGLENFITLGNLSARRDWGHARDYVRAMWLMTQKEAPDDYVIATGETHTIAEFCQAAFKCVGIADWEDYVMVDPKFLRPAEVDLLIGNPIKAFTRLGWSPDTSFEELIREMVHEDVQKVRLEMAPSPL